MAKDFEDMVQNDPSQPANMPREFMRGMVGPNAGPKSYNYDGNMGGMDRCFDEGERRLNASYRANSK